MIYFRSNLKVINKRMTEVKWYSLNMSQETKKKRRGGNRMRDGNYLWIYQCPATDKLSLLTVEDIRLNDEG